MTIIQSVKGMNDLFQDELATWQVIELLANSHFHRYGYSEIRTPILEDLTLFVRSVGETTDIVEKEMYSLEDRDGKMLCLRPENTAGVVRALIENGKFTPDCEIKTYYIGPMFRRERPQRGRLRQFHQLGAEMFGIADASAEVEIITMLHDFFSDLELKDVQLRMNTLGQPNERDEFKTALFVYFSGVNEQLCSDCKRRLHTNVLRILDCKQPGCIALANEAPKILDHLGAESRAHFEQVQTGLTKHDVPFTVMPRLVRGLDYYTRTVFEFVATSGLGAQNTVAGGGRYDGLVEKLGGHKTPALGFSAGIERIALLLQEANTLKKPNLSPVLALVHADDRGRAAAELLARQIRKIGVYVEIDLRSRSVKAQMRRADRLSARNVMVIGEKEVSEGTAELKSLTTKTIRAVKLGADEIVSRLFDEAAAR